MQTDSQLLPAREGQSASDESNSVRDVLQRILSSPYQPAAPVILLTATLRWPIAARLAMAFTNLGCRVEAVCPRQHPVSATRAIHRTYRHTVLTPLSSLRAAIQSAAPDLIIPCDDTAAAHLHQLYVDAGALGSSASALRALLVRSLGSPEACALATARGRFMTFAAEDGVRVPETTVVATPGELDAWFRQHRFPAVVKIDRSWGGQGVAIVRNHEEAQRAFHFMTSRPPMLKAMARMLLDRDLFLFLNSLRDTRSNVALQDFIPGAPANCAVACWQGQVLAGASVEAIRTQHPTGPATVVRVIENPEMSEAVARLVHRLGLSGLWGFDFVLEASSGAAYLIEMNPRATPICHLALGAGQNLPAALYAQLAGTAPPALPATIDRDVIAMFPGEWHRDHASPFLRSAYHDTPWDEPALIRDCIDRPWSERGVLARLWARVRPKIAPAHADVDVEHTHDLLTPNQGSSPNTDN